MFGVGLCINTSSTTIGKWDGFIRAQTLPLHTALQTRACILALSTVTDIHIHIHTLVLALCVELLISAVELAYPFPIDVCTLVASRTFQVTFPTM